MCSFLSTNQADYNDTTSDYKKKIKIKNVKAYKCVHLNI